VAYGHFRLAAGLLLRDFDLFLERDAGTFLTVLVFDGDFDLFLVFDGDFDLFLVFDGDFDLFLVFDGDFDLFLVLDRDFDLFLVFDRDFDLFLVFDRDFDLDLEVGFFDDDDDDKSRAFWNILLHVYSLLTRASGRISNCIFITRLLPAIPDFLRM